MGLSPARILWLRRDLRIRDHPALRAALDDHRPVVPVFCFDRRLLGGRHASGPRTQFLLECLADLDRQLRRRGSGLVIRQGKPEEELVALAREVDAEAIHCSDDVGPFARRRDARVRAACAEVGLELHAHPGLNAIDGRRDLDRGRQALHRVLTLLSRLARGRSAAAAQCADRAAGPAREAEQGSHPLARIARPRPRGDRSRARRRDAGEAGARSVPRRIGGGVRARSRRARPAGKLPPLPLPSLRLHLAAPDRERASRTAKARRRFTASSAGATSTITCSPTSRATLARSFRIASGAGSPGVTPRSDSTPGAPGGPATRSSTRACASSVARVGCTTAPGSWSARS